MAQANPKIVLEEKRMDLNVEIRLGDVVQTRKQHPCGSNEWTVIRTGADIKIKCSGCGRIADQPYHLNRTDRLFAASGIDHLYLLCRQAEPGAAGADRHRHA